MARRTRTRKRRPGQTPTRVERRPNRGWSWSPPAVWAGLDHGWRLAIGLLVAQRLVLGLVALFAQLASNRDIGDQWGTLIIRGGEPWSFLLSSWQRGDALWYQKIAESGYGADDRSATYSPLFPLLARAVGALLGGQVVWGGLIVSSLAFVLAARLLYELTYDLTTRHPEGSKESLAARGPASRMRENPQATSRLGRQRASLAVLLLALFPSGFFLFAPFSESLFLAVTLAAFWFLRQGRWLGAGAAGLLASLARSNGVALLFPFAWEVARRSRVGLWTPGTERRPPPWVYLLPGIPALGALLWVLYAGGIVGESRSTILSGAFRRLQAAWPGAQPPPDLQSPADLTWQFVPPWDPVGSSLAYLHETFSGLRPVAPFEIPGVELLNLIGLLGFCGLGILVLRWLPLAYGLYLWPNLVVLLTRKLELQPLLSTNRIILVLFPCFMVLAMLLVRWPKVAALWLTASATLQLALLTQFVQWRFVA